jgi:hypothetical protein
LVTNRNIHIKREKKKLFHFIAALVKRKKIQKTSIKLTTIFFSIRLNGGRKSIIPKQFEAFVQNKMRQQ